MSIFKRKKKPRKGATILERSLKWGDSISPWGTDEVGQMSKIMGWKRPLPTKGDLLRTKMTSGRSALFLITDVQPCGNPTDQFFADVEFYKYEN